MSSPIPITSTLDEETARAEVYGLLALLFHSAPGPGLHDALRAAPTEAPAAGGYLEEPWRKLVGLARDMEPAAVAQEYDALFGGVGKPEVYLFGSHYLAGFLNEKPLARLRTDLDALGLERSDAMGDTEDHVAYVFEVMRYLVAGDDVAVANLTQQKAFFTAHVQPWVMAMCDAVAAHPRARFYAGVAGFARAFMDVEAQGFDMLA